MAETVFELIRYRREESLQKDRKRKGNGKRYNLIEGFEDFDLDSPLSKWNQAVLKGVISLNDCEENDIIKIIDILEEAGDKKELKIAKQLLSYKKDISILFVTANHWEAVDRMEELFQLPIARPSSFLFDNLVEFASSMKKNYHPFLDGRKRFF